MHKITRIGDLINVIKTKEFISFDLFDTLIRRRYIHANEVHDTVSAYVLSQIGHRRDRSPMELTQLRYRTTDALKASDALELQEPLLDIIWDRILRRDIAEPFQRRKLVERIVSFEFALELSNLALVAGAKDLLARLKADGKTLIAASDMYFDSDRIGEFLNKLEILHLFDHIYVSGEVNLTKQTGELFGRILKDLDVSPTEMMHVGDNPHSDIAMALSAGITPILVEQPDLLALERPAYGKRERIEEEVADIIKAHLFSLLLDGQDRKADHIYFMGRDGCAISRFLTEWDSPLVNTFLQSPGHSDVYLNRAISCWAGIDFAGPWLDQSIGLAFWLKHGKASIREISDILGIDEVPTVSLAAELYANRDTDVVVQAYRDAGLTDKVKASLLKKRKTLVRYLQDLGLFNYSSVVFSDVGYSGTALRDLNALILAHNCDDALTVPQIALNLIATQDNYEENARRASPFVDFATQTTLPASALPDELKKSFAWLEFFFKHPTLEPVVKFNDTDAGLVPELVHRPSQDLLMPSDRVRTFAVARDDDIALLWMTAVDFNEDLTRPIIKRFAQPDMSTIEQMRDEVSEQHALGGTPRSIILELPGTSPDVVAITAQHGDYWIPGSIVASTGSTLVERSLAKHSSLPVANVTRTFSARWKSQLRRIARKIKPRKSIPPVPGFDAAFYGSYYSDLRQFRGENELLLHYWSHGRKENRLVSRTALLACLEAECGPVPKDFDSAVYLQLNSDIAEFCDTPEQALTHYMRRGLHEKRPYRANDDDIVKQFDRLRAKGSLQLTPTEDEGWRHGETIFALYLRRHNVNIGPWINEIDVAEFRALHSAWCGPVTNKAECIVAILEVGLDRQPSLSLALQFDDGFYRGQCKSLEELSARELYRHYLNVGCASNLAPSEQVAVRRLWGRSDFPSSFDWEGYRDHVQHLSRDASRASVLEDFVEKPGVERLKFVRGFDGASLIEAIATRAWRQHGRIAEAAELYQAALQAGGSPGRLHHVLGDLFLQSGDEHKALHHFRIGLSEASPDRWSFIHAARILIDKEDHASALVILSAGQNIWQEMAPWRRMVDRALQGLCDTWLENVGHGSGEAISFDELDSIFERVTQKLPQAAFIGTEGAAVLVVTTRPIDTYRQVALSRDITVCSALDVSPSDMLSALLTHTLVIFHEVPLTLSMLQAIALAKSLGIRTITWLGNLIPWEGYNLSEALWNADGNQGSALRLSNLWEMAVAARYCDETVIALPGCRRCVEVSAPNSIIHEVQSSDVADRGRHDRRVVLVVPHDKPSPAQMMALASALQRAAADAPHVFYLLDPKIASRRELLALTSQLSLIRSDIDLPNLADLISTVDAVIQFEPEPLRPYEAWREASMRDVPSLMIQRSGAGINLHGNTFPNGDDLAEEILRIAHVEVKSTSDNIIEPKKSLLSTVPAVAAKPRILFANVFFAPQVIGGATRVLKDNIDFLLEHHSDEFEIAIFTADEQNERAGEWRLDSYHGVPVFRVATPQEINMDWRALSAMTQARFGAVLAAFKPALVHIHCLQRLTATIAETCHSRRIPYIVTLHDAWWISDFWFLSDESGLQVEARKDFYDQPRLGNVDLAASVNRASFLRSTLMGAERRLAVSASFAGIYEACGIPCDVVENGTSRIAPVRRATNDRVHLCHVGGLQHHKGAYLVEAALRNNTYDNLHYTIVDLARSPSDTTHTVWGTTPVTITGKMTTEEMAHFYARMNILLAPSTWPESYGLVSREALAHGLWVIAGDIGAMGDPVEPGYNGFIVSVTDAEGVAQALRIIDQRPDIYRKSPNALASMRMADDQSRELVEIYREMTDNTEGGWSHNRGLMNPSNSMESSRPTREAIDSLIV